MKIIAESPHGWPQTRYSWQPIHHFCFLHICCLRWVGRFWYCDVAQTPIVTSFWPIVLRTFVSGSRESSRCRQPPGSPMRYIYIHIYYIYIYIYIRRWHYIFYPSHYHWAKVFAGISPVRPSICLPSTHGYYQQSHACNNIAWFMFGEVGRFVMNMDHWNGNVIAVMKFSSLAALDVVISYLVFLITFSVASDDISKKWRYFRLTDPIDYCFGLKF